MHRLIPLALVLLTLPMPIASGANWSIPLAGNAYRTDPPQGRDGLRRSGSLQWQDDNSTYSVFFHVDRIANLNLSIRGGTASQPEKVFAVVGGTKLNAELKSEKVDRFPLGSIEIPKAGYVRVDLKRASDATDQLVELESIDIQSDTAQLKVSAVLSNKGNMFYWGRRGPSVHLRYSVPKVKPIRYAYSEITVPKGQDPIGSYFMANGFGEGYFGIQVNSNTERRVLFSVWSPFKTDNPRDIPKDQQIETLGHGPDVHVGKFGNEGSGGQSYLVYPWKAGTTYRFLTEVVPDGSGNTRYTSWFGEASNKGWILIASFQRPKTDTHLRGFHSFLENFSPTTGDQGRRVNYSNVWVRDVDGQWHACKEARFSVDATGRGGHRLDFAGGSEGDSFFLRNCGFFSKTTKAGSLFQRSVELEEPPTIDFSILPRGDSP